MREYCRDLLTENFWNPVYLSGVACSSVGSSLQLDFTFDSQFGNAMNKELCSALFQDQDFLNRLSSAYETTLSEAMLTVDSRTGFPEQIQLAYSGSHTIYGTPYLLSTTIEQNFTLPE